MANRESLADGLRSRLAGELDRIKAAEQAARERGDIAAAERYEAQLQSVVDQLARIADNGERAWTFEVRRDAEDRITGMTARPL